MNYDNHLLLQQQTSVTTPGIIGGSGLATMQRNPSIANYPQHVFGQKFVQASFANAGWVDMACEVVKLSCALHRWLLTRRRCLVSSVYLTISPTSDWHHRPAIGQHGIQVCLRTLKERCLNWEIRTGLNDCFSFNSTQLHTLSCTHPIFVIY